MAAIPTTPDKSAGRRVLITPGLTRATSVRSPTTPETPFSPQTPTPAAVPGKVSLKPSLKQRANVAADGSKPADDLDVEIPPWDRTAELVWIRRDATSDDTLWNDELLFQQNSVRMAATNANLRPAEQDDASMSSADSKLSPLLPMSPGSGKSQQRKDIAGKDNGKYFSLPDRVRHKIAQRIVMSHSSGKPIRLNSPVFLKPIWPVNGAPGKSDPPAWTTEYFDSLDSVLRQLDPYLSACFAFRIDILTTLFLSRRFHVVYSPLVKPMTSPLATQFLDIYGVYMKWINLEVDLSHLAGNWHPASADLAFGLHTLRSHVERFVECQLSRHGGTTLQSLIIMVRRYHGVRQPPKRVVLENVEDKCPERDVNESLSSPLSATYTRSWQESPAGHGTEDKTHETLPFLNFPKREMEAVVTEYLNQEQDKGKGLMTRDGRLHVEITETVVDLDRRLTQTSVSSLPLPTPARGTPFCPDENLHVLDPLKRLGLAGLIDNLCLVGASKRYTTEFIEAFLTPEQMADRRERHHFCHFRNPPRAYPLTPGQRSAIEQNDAVQILEHETDPQKWTGLFGCAPTEHWKKYDVGPFNFKPAPFKALRLEEATSPVTPFPNSPLKYDHDSWKGRRRQFSITGRVSRRRRSASSLISFITRSSSLNDRPGSASRVESGDRTFTSSSIPALVPESPSRALSLSPSTAVFPPPTYKKRKYKTISKRRSFIFPSRIPILSHQHMRSPPEFRSILGAQRTPISLPYDKGHLVSGHRSVSGHRFGFTRMMDTLRRKVDEARAGTNGCEPGGAGLNCSGFNRRTQSQRVYGNSRSFSEPTMHTRPASSSAAIPGPSTRPIALGRSASTSTTRTIRPLSSRVRRASSLTRSRRVRTDSLSSNGSDTTTGTVIRLTNRELREMGTGVPSEGLDARDGRNLKSMAGERGTLRPGGGSNGNLSFVAGERETLKVKTRDLALRSAIPVMRGADKRAISVITVQPITCMVKSNSTGSPRVYQPGMGAGRGAAR